MLLWWIFPNLYTELLLLSISNNESFLILKQIFIKHQVRGKGNSYRHNLTHHRLEKWTPSILNAQSFQMILTFNLTIINMTIACYVLATTCCVGSITRRPAKLSRLMNSIENKTLVYVMPHCLSVMLMFLFQLFKHLFISLQHIYYL